MSIASSSLNPHPRAHEEIGRIAWSYVSSEENNKTFGRDQSFVVGSPTDFCLQFMIKDSKKYAATGGWGYSSFGKDGKPSDAASKKSCYPCHQAIHSRDYVFTHYTIIGVKF